MKNKKTKLIAFAIIIFFAIVPIATTNSFKNAGGVSTSNSVNSDLLGTSETNFKFNMEEQGSKSRLIPDLISYNQSTVAYNVNWSFIRYLKDNPNEYKKIWEPWLTKAAIHSIVVSDDMDTIAFGGGYLYDNEIHIYRWNYEKNEYEKAWDSGDQIIGGDVISLDYGDTDNNQLMEIVAGSSDGYVYVFEQKHIFDPLTKMESVYELVWKSPYLGPVWNVKVADLDRDYLPEIIAGTWNNKIYMFEYYNHSNYPFTPEHWIDYRLVWSSGDVVESKVFAMETGDFNGNGLPDLLVGTRQGLIYLFENNGTVIDVNGYPFALTQDNSYELIWFNNESSFAPILSISAGDTDGDGIDEASIVAVTQSAFILDYDEITDTFSLIKLYYNIKSWEKGSGALLGDFPVDYWMDWSIYAENVFYINASNYVFEEPIPLSNLTSELKYLNTAMAGPTDGKFSQFLPNSTHNATAILDFGSQEETVGDGSSAPDFYIEFNVPTGFNSDVNNNSIRFFISPDNAQYLELTDYTKVTVSSTVFRVYFNIDDVLRENKWRFARYLKIVVYPGNKYAIDSIYTYAIEKQLTDVMSTMITNIYIRGDRESPAILFGTLQGNLVVFEYNETSGKYNEIYNALDLDGFLLGTHIWYIARTKGDSKYPYWIFRNKYSFTAHGFTINSYDVVDLNYDGKMDVLVGTTDGRILAIMNTGTGYVYDASVSTGMFGDVNSYFSTFTNKRLVVRMADVLASTPGRELLVGAFPDGSFFPQIFIFYLDNFYIQKYNKTKYVPFTTRIFGSDYSDAFYLSSEIYFDVVDVNKDGLKDLVMVDFLNGMVYYAEQQPGETFIFNKKYFSGINELKGSKKLGKIEVVDFNNDGISDLVASYNGKNGGTYFENVGTYTSPIWREKKTLFSNSGYSTTPTTNLGYNNYTQFTVWKENGNYKLMSLNSYTNELAIFDGETTGVTTLLFATYPLLEKINMAPISTITPPLNYGYHIISVWNTIDELKDWTQAVAHADVDGDGKGEVIVGDFDNNVYIFEHIINNTYKRAFRSQDLYYEYLTDVSPYYSDELGGLEDFFKIRVWEHARFVEAGTDVDNDGLKEVIAVTGFQVFIFEHKGYENYKLEYKISLLDHPLGEYIRFVGGITAFAYTPDMDYDGFGEIILAVGGILFIYQLNSNGKFTETFSYDIYDLALFNVRFRNNMWIDNGDYYDLPGAMILTPIEVYNISDLLDNMDKYRINSITVGDMDENGLKEIFIAGKVEPCVGRVNGFLYGIEAEMGTMYLKWVAPENITYRNPINVITIADTDYDSQKELIIGGELGIDIFESDARTYLKYETSITMTPDHPYNLPLRSMGLSIFTSSFINTQDMVALPGGKVIIVFESQYSTRGLSTELYYIYSTDYGKTWSSPISLTANLTYPSNYVVQWEKNPQIIHRSKTNTYVTVVWYANVSVTTSKFIVASTSIDINTFTSGPSITEILSTTTNNIVNLRFWGMYHVIFLTSFIYGLSYLNISDGKLYIWTYYRIFLGFNPIYSWGLLATYTNISGMLAQWTYYGYDISYIGDSTYMIVFLGLPRGASKYVIFASKTNSSFVWGNLTSITSVSAATGETLSYDWKTGTIFLTYYTYEAGKIYKHELVSSTDGGLTWRNPIEIERYYDGLYEVCYNGYPVLYHNISNRIGPVASYRTRNLVSTVSFDGTFYYSFILEVYRWQQKFIEPLPYLAMVETNIAVKLVNTTRWAFYDIGSVNELAVGDTDGDNRIEIVSNYYDDGFTVFEISGASPGKKNFTQVYTFDRLNNTLTDISIGDSNGNGFNEIVVSTEYGNVYSFEFRYYNWEPAIFGVPNTVDRPQPVASITNIDEYGLVDGDNDGVKEFYYLDNNQFLTMINLQTWATITIDYGALGAISVIEVKTSLGDRLIVLLANNTLHMINPATGQREKSFTTVISSANGLTINDRFILAYNTSAVQLLNAYNLSEIKTIQINTQTGNISYAIPVLSIGSVNLVAVKFTNGSIAGIDFETGTKAWNITTTLTVGILYVLDGNNDGQDEIYAINMTSTNPLTYEIIVIDQTSGGILNSVETRLTTIKKAVQFNIDDDSYSEILFIGWKSYAVMTTKTFELVYEATYPSNIENIFTGDFDGNSLTDIAITVSNEAVVTIVNNYGSTRVVILTGQPKAFPVFTDYDGDSTTEILTLLSNGTVLITEIIGFSETFTTVAYEKFSYYTDMKVFDNKQPMRLDGHIMSRDMNLDGEDELILSNGTAISVIEMSTGTILFVRDTGSWIYEFTVASYVNPIGSKLDIIYHNGTHISVIDLSGIIVLSFDARQTNIDMITKIFVSDFDGDMYNEIAVAMRTKIVFFEGKIPNAIRGYQTSIYTITGDYDGDGLLELAVKMVGPGDFIYNLEVIKYTGTTIIQLMTTTLFGTEANKYLPDINTLDIDQNGKDEILFFNLTGQIDIIDLTGVIGNIPTGIKNYALWVENDRMFNIPKAIAVKYAYEAFRIIDVNGTTLLEVKDASSTRYQSIDINGDGFGEYLGSTEGKIFAISTKGIEYYTKVGEQTSGVAISFYNGQTYIIVLADNGYIKIYKTITTQVTGSGPTTKVEDNNYKRATPISYSEILFITALMLIATIMSIIILRRKIN